MMKSEVNIQFNKSSCILLPSKEITRVVLNIAEMSFDTTRKEESTNQMLVLD